MENVINEIQELNSTISKHLKYWYGKGPQTCYSSLHENKLIIHINKFMTPSEKALLENNKEPLAYSFRTSVMDRICKDLQAEIHRALGISFNHYASDWDFVTDTGIILFQNEQANWKCENIDQQTKHHIENKVMKVSANVHKVPTHLEMVMFNKRMFAVKCHEVMLQVEKILYKKGHTDILQERAKEIKKSYQESLGEVMGKEVKGVYMIWDYQYDQSYFFFYLR
ncbi:Na-translocating system protein MpsC family protein [Oceanobacillus halophilus]|uniref:DUF2294 family protein n=1 Tax=Oceanobacillus halophilus TaxID=930130 RepID=A0A494ZVA3_9BACI|nr:Na-translocating system protein MpsC family protein [Oceanobacillus halophilus]RKQ30388.1 DUF2294 family protein [Oceanobacillus halophilus]